MINIDRVPMVLTESCVVRQGEVSNVSMTFSIPTGVTFWGHRIMLVPQYRNAPLDDSAGGTVWSKASWTAEQRAFDTGYSQALDLLWRISTHIGGKTYEYQNAPCSIPLMYSHCPPDWTSASSYPSGLTFDQEWYLPGGSSMTVTLTPTFTASAVAPNMNEYRIVGLLFGGKDVLQ